MSQTHSYMLGTLENETHNPHNARVKRPESTT